ncbi:MAG: bifunctional UDP-N-acetylglucosamine diphosphorylase/glucosamine-1-phosphate N-acetyltransferase GlmU [Pseudomonadales bacterium]|nr:bifunctional UDP-N-acetylglucosamine diphosphorylase/glucosamine-1-phosphate N-acetyltransferase GlmU [Pseudomonadales bacterium]
MSIEVIILAAGQGSRMKSELPKVLHAIAGKPMVKHVIDTVKTLDCSAIHVVVGHGADAVKNAVTDEVTWALQEQQLGTGHAVAQALPNVSDDSTVLILYGDVPLTSRDTLSSLVQHVNERTLALLTVNLDDPTGYGRIIRDQPGFVKAIVEQKDATPDQLEIKETNTGILAVKAHHLKKWLPLLSNSNAQGEYYLTDIIAMAVGDAMEIMVAQPSSEQEVQGVNNRLQLATLERWHQLRIADQLMTDGVTLADPARVDVRGTVKTGTDNFIDVNCVFIGEVTLGNHVQIGPNCLIKDATIGDDVVIEANTIIDSSEIGNACTIGPFARVRPGTVMAEKAKIGNFVETKKTIVGAGSKINHLSYVGDAVLGQHVNVGAGTITCNYDGVNKFKTTIGHGVFVGSNSSLVAPVTIGDYATLGAGSVITKTVETEQLAIARGKQRNIDGWQRPVKKQDN